MPAAKAVLSWLQHEALRIVSVRREVRRRDVIARCRISREVARRELAGLVRLGLLRRVGLGRGARYVLLSFWLTLLTAAPEWAAALI
jgi:predicted HTH transcriptional regulator